MDDEKQQMVEFNEEDIANYVLRNYILAKAGDWNNKRVERYLETESESDW
jgi:hypothetical protein